MSLLDAFLLDPNRINVWIAFRTDGIKGTGTQSDPWDGSSFTKLDAVMRGLSANTNVHFGPGQFETDGYYDGIPANTGWQAKPGMRIVGSGIDVTTLSLAGSSASDKHLFAIGHDLSVGGQPNLMDYFEVSDLTVDCNLSGQTDASVACGAVRIMGSHSRVRRIKVVNWGTNVATCPCFVVSVITADPASGVSGVVGCGIEDVIAIMPGSSAVNSPVTVLHAGPKDDSGTNSEGFGTGPFIRHCYVDCGSPTSAPECRALSMAWCKGGVVEGNQIHNTRCGGPYVKNSSSRDLVVRNNFYRNVFKGPCWELGALAPPYGLGSISRTGTVATASLDSAPTLATGERVSIDASPADFSGVAEVTGVQGQSFSFQSSATGASAGVVNSVRKVMGADRIIIEGNTIELASATSGELIGIQLEDGGISVADAAFPAYVFGDVLVRENRIRYLAGAAPAGLAGIGIDVRGARNLLIRNNTIESAASDPIRDTRCGSVDYSNNRTPGGALIPGVNQETSRKRDELETEAEDALVLALFNRK